MKQKITSRDTSELKVTNHRSASSHVTLNFASEKRLMLTSSMSENDLELLAQLEAANNQTGNAGPGTSRRSSLALESDHKSVKNFNPAEEAQKNRSDSISMVEERVGSRKNSSDSVSIRSLSSQSSQMSTTQNGGDNLEPESTPEQESVRIWTRLISEWEVAVKKKMPMIKELVYKGVPQELRCLAWQYLCGAHDCPIREKYSNYLRQTSACEKVIRRDIARTYPEHEFFREKDGAGQESLFNVMKAYSLHDREVGYCQGSAFIVGLLLMSMPEEETFSVLIQLMNQHRLRELFKPGMAELGVCMYQLEYLIQEHSPVLYKHFQAQSFHTSMYASGWFLTLFTTQLSLDMCCRIMDIFLLEGMEIIFRVGVAILLQSESDLLCMDMEEMLIYFQEKVPQIYANATEVLLEQAQKVKYNAKRMKKLEKEYGLLKSKENEDQVELRRLRSENRLLRQRIENLEKENGILADRLIQGQVTLAQEAEVMFVVKRELSQLREQNKELYRSLSASEQQITELKSKNHRKPMKYHRSLSVPAEQQEPGLYSHVRNLHAALNDLHKSMSTVPDSEEVESSEKFQALQEELIAVKLREAESNLALRELVNHVSELDKEWQKQLERTPQDKLSKSQSQALHEELMTCRLKAAEESTSNKQLKMRVVELETSNQITANQVQRMMDENEKLRREISLHKETERQLHHDMEDLTNKVTILDTKSKEDAMVTKINDVEHSQLVAELRQKIAELEIKNQEFQTANQISHQSSQPITTSNDNTTNGEMLQFKLTSNRVSFSTLDIKKGDFDSGSDDESADKQTDIGISLSPSTNNNNSTSSPSNGTTGSSSTKPKRMISMEMDS